MDLQSSSNTDRFIPSLLGCVCFFFALLNRKFLKYQNELMFIDLAVMSQEEFG